MTYHHAIPQSGNRKFCGAEDARHPILQDTLHIFQVNLTVIKKWWRWPASCTWPLKINIRVSSLYRQTTSSHQPWCRKSHIWAKMPWALLRLSDSGPAMVMEFATSVSIHMEVNISQKSKFKHHLVPVLGISNKNGVWTTYWGRKVLLYTCLYVSRGRKM